MPDASTWRAAAGAGVVALLLLSAGPPVPAGAQPPARDADAPGLADDSRQADLLAIQREIARLEERLGEVSREGRDLAGELARTELELELQERRVAEAVAARDLVAAALDESDRRAGELAERLEELRSGLRLSLGWLYRLGRHGSLRLFLSVSSRRELLPAIRTLRYLTRRNARAVERFQATREALEEERRQLAERRAELEEWVEREAGRRAELARLERRQSALLARLEAERSEIAERAGRLEDKARKLSALIDFLYGRSGRDPVGTPIQEFRGALDWPVEGEVEQGFGPRRDPRYRTLVPHNGLDIATRDEAPVKAVFPGEVLFAAPFEGFGLAVVVHHAGGVFSLYARLADTAVAAGDVVALGEIVGRSSGSLYLEIREENRPQDPLLWLR